MDFKQALIALAQGQLIPQDDIHRLMQDMLRACYSPAQVAAFFMLLKMKGESQAEMLGAAQAVREFIQPSVAHQPNLVISCRTGSDKLGALDLSIASAFAVAAAGCQLMVYQGSHTTQHRASVEFLKSASIKTELTAAQIRQCLDELGLAFDMQGGLPEASFAATEQLGVGSMANLLSLIAAPIVAKRYFVGVDNPKVCRPVAELLASLGAERVMVVQSDGLDAISLSSTTQVAEWDQGELKEYSILPDDFGVQAKSLIGLHQDSAEEALLLIRDALGNRRGHYAEKAADIIILNAGAAIYLSGVADSLRQGVSMAREVVANTLAGEKIRQLSTFSQSLN